MGNIRKSFHLENNAENEKKIRACAQLATREVVTTTTLLQQKYFLHDVMIVCRVENVDRQICVTQPCGNVREK